MCICINCFYIKNCSTYKIIEIKHNLIKKKSLFTETIFPKQTIIKTEINTKKTGEIFKDWDVSECTNFIEKPGNWFSEDKEEKIL